VARYSVLIKRSAAKEIEAIDSKKNRQRVVRRILGLADDPRLPGARKLSAREYYRIRQGEYRIVYSIGDDEAEVTVVKVGHRKDVYREIE